MKKELKRFVFTGLLTKHAVRDMEASGLLHKPDTSTDERREGELFTSVEEAVRSGSLQMQYGYRVLFVLENIVRHLISSPLHEADGVNWFDQRASSSMKQKVEQRKGN